jgi:hypothetical protein
VANHKKTQRPRKPSRPLPKVGSPKDDAYRLEHSRHDVVDFGLTEPRKGPLNWILVAVVVVLMVLGIISLILFT